VKGTRILASRLGLLTIVSLVVVSLGGVVLADADSRPAPPPAEHLLVVPKTTAGVIALSRSDARVVARYPSYSLVETADDAPLRAAGADRRDDMRDVATAAGRFDPAGRRSLAAKGAAEREEALALVQFVGPPKDDWLERLRATGAVVVTYQAQNAYIVHARGAAVDRLAGLVGADPAVRAVVPLGAADKVEGAAAGTARYALSTVAGKAGSGARAAAAADGRAVGVATTLRGLRTQYLELSAADVASLAADPAVVTIERDAPPAPADERADQIVAGNLTPPALTQPNGAAYLAWHNSKIAAPLDATIDITDSGLDDGASPTTHPDFHVSGVPGNPDRVAYELDYSDSGGDTRDCTGHGTTAASIAAGYNDSTGAANEDSAGFNYGLGVAPLARIGVSRIFPCMGPAPDFTPADIASAAFAGGATISNNSWGTGGTGGWGTYSARARDYDGLVRDAQSGSAGNQEMVEVFAAGNDGGTGEGTVAAEASAKNVITVGASEGVRPSGTDGCNIPNATSDNARQMAAFSSRGPTDDGRLKPDVVAPGTHITGARPTHVLYNGSKTCNGFFTSAYSLSSGTSEAAPQVAGAAALVRDWYEDTHGPAPSPALTKALLVNTASDLIAGPDNQQGWGRVNAGAALDSTTAREFYDQPVDYVDDPGDKIARSFTVPSSSQPVKVTLAWTDAPGSTSGDAFVNDLDLEVAAGGRTYKGNAFDGAWSRPGGTADPRDNVESVYLRAGTAARISVTVRATTLGDDGVPGTGTTPDQDFALVVSNATQQAAPVLAHASTTVTGGDGDGVLESDEQVGLTEQLRNAGDANAVGLTSNLTGNSLLGVSQGSSTYPDIAAGDGVGATATPYRAHLANGATCGADVSATLSIATTNAGTQTVPLVLPTGAPGALQSNTSSDVPKAIPDDNPTGVGSSLFIAERGRIKDLNVTLPSPGIVHPSDGDLVIDLIGPDGTTVRLADHVRGPDYAGHSFSGTTFDDEAVNSISAGSAPFTGNFRPQHDQLARFDGKSRRGTWTLRVRDLFAGDVGTLRAWGVASQKALCNVDRSAPDTVIGAGPRNPTTSTSATFSIGSSDATAIFECRLDFSAWAPCAKTISYSGLALGAHSFAARAIDGSDNEDASPATYNWKVTQPAASFVLAPVEERLSTAAAGHYRVLAACASACRASAKLVARVGRRTITLGSSAKRRRSAGTAAVAVAVGKRGRRALRGHELVKAKLSVTLTQGSAKLTLKRSVSLRREAGLRRIARRGMRLWAVAVRSTPLTGTLSLSAAQARRLDLKVGRRKRLTIARGSATAGRTPKVLTLKLGRAARRAFSRARRVGTLLEGVAGEAPEPLRTAKLSKTLVR
jgi:subtilisin-like proprotein convertase family protein